MGYAKYYEDIEDTRVENLRDFDFGGSSNATTTYSVSISYDSFASKLNDSFAIYVNNKKMSGKEQFYSDIYTLSLYFPKTVEMVEVYDDMGNFFTIKRSGNGLHNISTQVLTSPFTKLYIKIPKTNEIFTLKQKLNIQKISTADIYNKKYSSEIFDQFVSEDALDEIGYLTYLKMLVTEEADPAFIVDRVCMTSFYKKLPPDFFWTYFLVSEFSSKEYLIKSRLYENAIIIFIAILKGEYEKAEVLLKQEKSKEQEILGCKILLGLLKNDKLLVDYQKEKYVPKGYIGALVSLLFAFKENDFSKTKEHLYLLSLIKQYPLVKAVFSLYGFEDNQLTKALYPLLATFDYKIPVLYYRQMKNREEAESILKEALEYFDDSEELKELSYSNNFDWVRKYITVDSDLYYQELEKVNNSRSKPYNTSFLKSIKVDEDIEITNLGKGNVISANCVFISYKGYNILLDVGLDPREPEETAYPKLDEIGKNIDFIIVSHAHIDHCGGLPKAHAMWPNARIIATAPTKRLMRYLFNDAAKIKNDKYSEFEITNITIEKEITRETLFHTNETEYEQWIFVSNDIKFKLHNAGHMIGAAMVEIKIKDKTILYTGDFTDYNQALSTGIDFLKIPRNIDLLISEATYVEKPNFDWTHCCEDLKNQILNELKNKRTVLIPSAAIGRAQELVCMLGEMALNGELPKKTKLYLGGLAIPMSTQISPYFNEKYDLILEQFNELGSFDVPDENSVIIASSNYLSRGSASFRILKNICMDHSVTIFSNTKVNKEAEVMIYKSPDVLVKNYSLPTHASNKGIQKLLDWTKPNFVTFIHCGGDSKDLVDNTIQSFNNDICVYESIENKQIKVFDLLNLMEECLV